jgi:hypothetical protein
MPNDGQSPAAWRPFMTSCGSARSPPAACRLVGPPFELAAGIEAARSVSLAAAAGSSTGLAGAPILPQHATAAPRWECCSPARSASPAHNRARTTVAPAAPGGGAPLQRLLPGGRARTRRRNARRRRAHYRPRSEAGCRDPILDGARYGTGEGGGPCEPRLTTMSAGEITRIRRKARSSPSRRRRVDLLLVPTITAVGADRLQMLRHRCIATKRTSPVP